MHVFPKRHVPDVHITTIHKNQSLEATRMLINGIKDHNLVHSHS